MYYKQTAPFAFLAVSIAMLVGGCGEAVSHDRKNAAAARVSSEYGPPEIAGSIESDDIRESSGLAASRCQENVLWTHNDGGDPLIFAMTYEGRHLGVWKVPNARNTDWEDIAFSKDAGGKCYLLISDTGTNKKERTELEIYRIAEPVISPADSGSTAKSPLISAPAEVLRFTYADAASNAETLLVHPQTGDIYILTKQQKGPSSVHKLKPVFGSESIEKTEKLGELTVPARPPGQLTGGSIAPDGRRVILCDVQNGYELTLADDTTAFDEIWKQAPKMVDLGTRKQGEGVTYSPDGNAIYASSEKKGSPLIRVKRR